MLRPETENALARALGAWRLKILVDAAKALVDTVAFVVVLVALTVLGLQLYRFVGSW